MDESVLLEQARLLAARERGVEALQAAARASKAGGAVALGMVVLLRLLDQPAWDGLAPLLVLPAGAALARLARPLDLVASAYRADGRLGLQERLGTALEWLLSDRPRTLMAQVMLRDAAERASRVEPRAAFPVRWPRSLGGGLLLALLAVALAGLPGHLPWWDDPGAQALEAARRQTRELEQEVREVEGQRETVELQDLAARVEALARDLARPDLDPQAALQRISALSEELQQVKGLGNGQGAVGGTGSTRGDQAQEARRLREAARDPGSPEGREALRQLASDGESSEAVRQAAREALEALEGGDPQAAGEILARGTEPGQASEPGEGTGGSGNGQGGSAQGNPGQQLQEGQGQGKGGADFGRGTTLQGQQASEAEGQGKRDFVLDRQSRRTSEWTEEYRRLHPPRRDHLATADTRTSGRLGSGQTLPGAGEGRGIPTLGRDSARPLREGYAQAREAAEEAVSREEIPASRRDLVRNYFEGIDPRR